MNGSMPIRGRRLYLRPFEAMDFLDVYEHYASDPEVARWCTWNTHESSETTFAYLQSFVDRYEEGDYYHWAIELPTVGVIGAIEVVRKDHASGTATLGYVLSRSHWGQGFMSEALQLVLNYLEGEGYMHFDAVCLAANAASARVLEKNGFRKLKEGREVVKGVDCPVCFYARSKGDKALEAPGRKEEEPSFTIEGGTKGKEDDPFSASYFFPFEGK